MRSCVLCFDILRKKDINALRGRFNCTALGRVLNSLSCFPSIVESCEFTLVTNYLTLVIQQEFSTALIQWPATEHDPETFPSSDPRTVLLLQVYCCFSFHSSRDLQRKPFLIAFPKRPRTFLTSQVINSTGLNISELLVPFIP